MHFNSSKIRLIVSSVAMSIGRAALAANPTWAVVEPPPAILDSPIYFYVCSDAACASQTRLANNGFVTKVPTWQTLTPATWVFLETGGAETYYALWKANGSNWDKCILHLDPSGEIGAKNTCPGAVRIAESSSTDVSKIALGAAAFPQSKTPPVVTPKPFNPSNARSITFANDSSASGLCVQTDSAVAYNLCMGAQVHDVSPENPYAHSLPQNGDDSKAAQVIGIRYTKKTPWIPTGEDAKSQVYATKVEWTAFPTEVSESAPPGNTDHSIGPTTIDVSLVDGFNVGVELVPDQDTVCAVSEHEGGPLVFKLFSNTSPMAKFPKHGSTLQDTCPTSFEVKLGKTQTGCYSQCSWSNTQRHPSQQQIDQNCCAGDYDTYATCDPVIDMSYIDNVADKSEGVYAWAYNDFRGTFTCDGSASFSLRVTDVFSPRPAHRHSSR